MIDAESPLGDSAMTKKLRNLLNRNWIIFIVIHVQENGHLLIVLKIICTVPANFIPLVNKEYFPLHIFRS